MRASNSKMLDETCNQINEGSEEEGKQMMPMLLLEMTGWEAEAVWCVVGVTEQTKV